MDGLAWKIRQHLIYNLVLVTYTDVVNAKVLHCQDHRFHVKGRKIGGEPSQEGETGGSGASGALEQQQSSRHPVHDSRQGDQAKRFRTEGHRPDGGFR